MENHFKLELLRLAMQIEAYNEMRSKETIINTYKELVSLIEENNPK